MSLSKLWYRRIVSGVRLRSDIALEPHWKIHRYLLVNPAEPREVLDDVDLENGHITACDLPQYSNVNTHIISWSIDLIADACADCCFMRAEFIESYGLDAFLKASGSYSYVAT